jgi:phosphate transport system protein
MRTYEKRWRCAGLPISSAPSPPSHRATVAEVGARFILGEPGDSGPPSGGGDRSRRSIARCEPRWRSKVLSCCMRTAFHEQLDALARLLADMCGSASTAMERATEALLQADLLRAEQVITDHELLVEMKSRAEGTAFVLLALQSPVAGDLRVIVGCMQNVADAERMGGLALHVAKIVRRRHPVHALPEEVNGYFAEMGRIAVDLGRAARDVVLSSDPERAAQIRLDDDAMDDLHRHLLAILMDKEWKHGVASAVDATLLGRFYERFADHAVEIGRRVVFQATGR